MIDFKFARPEGRFPQVSSSITLPPVAYRAVRLRSSSRSAAIELGVRPVEVGDYRTFRAGIDRDGELGESWRGASELDRLNPGVSFWMRRFSMQ